MTTPAQPSASLPTPAISLHSTDLAGRLRLATDEPRLVKFLLVGASLLFLVLVLFVPLISIFVEAFRKGLGVYVASFTDPHALSAAWVTFLTAAICVPLNLVFGLAAAWAITKFNFRGKSLLISLIDLPFAVSPVISGLVFVLLFGMRGWFGPWFIEHNMPIIFEIPGIILATLFVTFPFVARELIPLMQEQGSDEELAAISLGASGWQTFWRVTLPNVKWALLYGVILCNARAMGEFGAVNVVSARIKGATNTLPLHVELLYNEFNQAAAFAVASMLVLLAFITLAAKSVIEWRVRREYEQALEPTRAEE
jgi:sulfate transport system permease protein